MGKQCCTVDSYPWVCNINDSRGDGMDSMRILLGLISRFSVTWDVDVMLTYVSNLPTNEDLAFQ